VTAVRAQGIVLAPLEIQAKAAGDCALVAARLQRGAPLIPGRQEDANTVVRFPAGLARVVRTNAHSFRSGVSGCSRPFASRRDRTRAIRCLSSRPTSAQRSCGRSSRKSLVGLRTPDNCTVSICRSPPAAGCAVHPRREGKFPCGRMIPGDAGPDLELMYPCDVTSCELLRDWGLACREALARSFA
jgi:hypothetical protein